MPSPKAARAKRLEQLDEQRPRKIPVGAISPTYVDDDDIYIQFNARFRPIQPADDEEEEVVDEQVVDEQVVDGQAATGVVNNQATTEVIEG